MKRFPLRVVINFSKLAASFSRSLGLGEGSVIGGRVALILRPDTFKELCANKYLIFVTGTNGKTTTTYFLKKALEKLASKNAVASNVNGSNMIHGITYGLITNYRAKYGVFEVDELWLIKLLENVTPSVIVFTNLSRDQLDRFGEVKKLSLRLKDALDELGYTYSHDYESNEKLPKVIYNCDDPLLAFIVRDYPNAYGVSLGSSWSYDARSCPLCQGELNIEKYYWQCLKCDFKKGSQVSNLSNNELIMENKRLAISLSIPGEFNVKNAALAANVLQLAGFNAEVGLEEISKIDEIYGRYKTYVSGKTGVKFRLVLAKNPAGFLETFSYLKGNDLVIVAINARAQDGRDTSWLYDVDFESLQAKRVIATGERYLDIGMRLKYAGLDVEIEPRLEKAINHPEVANFFNENPIYLLANYSAFWDAKKFFEK